MSMPAGLDAWLQHLEALRPEHIELGLGRTRRVAEAAGLLSPDSVVITVAGTNGKGSVCAMLDSILRAAGYRVGLYTSPHLLHFQERIRLDGANIGDDALCAAFAAIESARGETPLTYFEFTTLAAMAAFRSAGVEVVILEVGLGGRLDAVNVFDADCALVTSVDLDHQDWLGDSREAIGREKAGIYRAGRPAICADPHPPQSLLQQAAELGADLWLAGRDYTLEADRQQWSYRGRDWQRAGLPWPALRGSYQLANAGAALAVLEALGTRLPVAMGDIRHGLLEVQWPGRFQIIPGRPVVILDVAHNPHGARALRAALENQGFFENTWAVVGMLADKDSGGVFKALEGVVTQWAVCGLSGPRGLDAEALAMRLQASGSPAAAQPYATPEAAFRAVYGAAGENDRIVVLGSFLTVAAVLALVEDGAYRNLRHGH